MGCFCQKNKISPVIIVNATKINTVNTTTVKSCSYFDKLPYKLSRNILDFLQYRELKEAAKCSRKFKSHSCDVDILRKFFKNRRSVCEMNAGNHLLAVVVKKDSERRKSCLNGLINNPLHSFPTFFDQDEHLVKKKAGRRKRSQFKDGNGNRRKSSRNHDNNNEERRKSVEERKVEGKRMNLQLEEMSDLGYGSNMVDSSKLLNVISNNCSSIRLNESKVSYGYTKTKTRNYDEGEGEDND